MEKLKKRIKKALTVKQVIEILKTFPENALVGTVGYFDEAYPLNKHSFTLTKAYISPINEKFNIKKKLIDIVQIDVKDIVEEVMIDNYV